MQYWNSWFYIQPKKFLSSYEYPNQLFYAFQVLMMIYFRILTFTRVISSRFTDTVISASWKTIWYWAFYIFPVPNLKQYRDKCKWTYLCIVMHRWTFYTFRNDVYHMYTWSIIAIPILWCHEIWQWRSQNPGLSAKKRIKVNPASGTITVSFRGGFLRFRSIFPALFRSMTFCLVIRLPEIHQGKNFDSDSMY